MLIKKSHCFMWQIVKAQNRYMYCELKWVVSGFPKKFAIHLIIVIIYSACGQLNETVIRLIQGVAVLYSLSQVGYGHRKLHCMERGNNVKRPEIPDMWCFDFKIKDFDMNSIWNCRGVYFFIVSLKRAPLIMPYQNMSESARGNVFSYEIREIKI